MFDFNEMNFRLRDTAQGPHDLKAMRYLCRRGQDIHYEKLASSMNLSNTELIPPLLDKLRVFSRPEVIENGSFCYNGLSEIEFTEILTGIGVCFIINFDLKNLNNERFIFKFFSSERNFSLLFCSVSRDFLGSRKLTGKCKNLETSRLSKTLMMNFNLSRLEKCSRYVGDLILQDSNSFEFLASLSFVDKLFSTVNLKPKILTTDESLRKYSPEV